MDIFKLTDERQQELINLYKPNPSKFHHEITQIIRDHPSVFAIMDVAKQDDGDLTLT